MFLFIIFVVAQAYAGDESDYSQINVNKNEMAAQLEKMRKEGQISEQQLKDAKAAVGGLSDGEMKDLTQKGARKVQDGSMGAENEGIIRKQLSEIEENNKKMEEMNAQE
jgi:hypothetical protein